MIDELNHRVKNTLASVQAIARRTLQGIDPSVRDALDGRLQALAAAHDVLTRENWDGASLHDVVTAALAAHGGSEDGRFRVSGPSLRLNPRAALAMALCIHELLTNAAKYGALATTSGMVTIEWEFTHEPPPRIQLAWTERGGPPVVPPVQRGFGSQLIESILARDLGGDVQVDFSNLEGITCAMSLPLAELTASPAGASPPRVASSRDRRATLAAGRVLLVEDEALVAMMLEDYLSELGYEVVAAAYRLEDALEKARTLSIDLALLDVNLAGKLSFPVADVLNERGIPFVFATGYGVSGLPEALRLAPVLVKPFRPDQLGAALRRIRQS